MNTTTSNIKTAAEYQQLAQDARRRSAESWERSDTDGALSQWASDRMANHYADNARVVEQGGVRRMALVELATGEVIAHFDAYLEGQYGWYWLVRDDAAAERVGRFVTTSSAQKAETRDRNNAKKGVREVTVLVPLADCYESRKTGTIEVHSYDNATVVE